MENINFKYNNNNCDNRRVEVNFYNERIPNIEYRSNFVQTLRKEQTETGYIVRKNSRVFDE